MNGRTHPLLMYLCISVCFATILLWTTERTLTFKDAVYLAVSIVTSTGLSVTDYTAFSTAAHAAMFIAMLLGSNILLAAAPSFVRWLKSASMCRRLRHRVVQPCDAEAHNRQLHSERHKCTSALLIVLLCGALWAVQVLGLAVLLFAKFPLRWAFFLSVSCVNNVGLSASRSDFLKYRHDMYTVACCAVALPLGNTLFPALLRCSLNLVRILASRSCDRQFFGLSGKAWHDAAKELLQAPPPTCTHLFSRRDTVVIVMLWVSLTLTEFVLFVPEFNSTIFPTGAGISDQALLAFFQTVSVRTAGLMVFDITLFRVGHLAFWILCMYITAYPVVLAGSNKSTSPAGREMALLYIAIVGVLFAEDQRIQTAAQVNAAFFLRTCFEVVSAFGNVGLSLSQRSGVVSFSSELNWLSRSVLMGMMVVGKLRCLPWSDEKDNEIDDMTDAEEMNALDPLP